MLSMPLQFALPKTVDWDLVVTAVTAIVAVFALIQPWIIYAWNRKFRQGSIVFYEEGQLVLYFGDNGVAVELAGKIRAHNEDMFVRSMRLVLTRNSDKATRSLVWKTSRVPFPFGNDGRPQFLLASTLLATTATPAFVDAILFDEESERRLNQVRDQLQLAWLAQLETILPPDPSVSQNPNPLATQSSQEDQRDQSSIPQEEYQQMEQIYADFLLLPDIQDLKNSITKSCYWEEGAYQLRINIVTADPNKTFSFEYSFDLGSREAMRLHRNSDGIMRFWCEMPTHQNASYSASIDYQRIGGNSG